MSIRAKEQGCPKCESYALGVKLTRAKYSVAGIRAVIRKDWGVDESQHTAKGWWSENVKRRYRMMVWIFPPCHLIRLACLIPVLSTILLESKDAYKKDAVEDLRGRFDLLAHIQMDVYDMYGMKFTE
ncbi:hypothetical protein BDN70DRAFT_900862 [Pholiota conissans]|uniref:Uncharacterized protein n=1 Tax=Pholiota conissans TaxID=109636 RepID=A0A9P5YQD2_9AGAR|nr:hypothetical protein BDN70DRAFT_900862 [Pholiota conissans]